MAARLALLVLALGLIALAGCSGPDPDRLEVRIEPGPPAGAPGEDTYWFVQATGTEVPLGSGPHVACDRVSDHTVDAERRAIAYAQAAYPFRPGEVTRLVAFLAGGSLTCPAVDRLHGNATAEAEAGVLGRFAIAIDPATGAAEVRAEGDLLGVVQPGEQMRVAGEGQASGHGETWAAAGELVVANHGAWPRGRLTA